MMFKIAIAALVLVATFAVIQSLRLQSKMDELALVERNIKSLEMERDQARLAEAVAEAAQKRIQAKADEYDAIREALLSGDNDAPVPEWFSDWLFSLGFSVRPDD